MTLDSDSELAPTQASKGQRGFQKHQIRETGDDELVIDRSFKVGQQTLNPLSTAQVATNWSFLDAVKTDRPKLDTDFKVSTIEEKVQSAIKTHGISIPNAPEKAVQLEQV